MRLHDANPAIYDISYRYERGPLTQEEATRLAQARCAPLSDRRGSRRRASGLVAGIDAVDGAAVGRPVQARRAALVEAVEDMLSIVLRAKH